MKVLQEGVKAPLPWKKVVICETWNEGAKASCQAILEVEEKDLQQESYLYAEDGYTEYSYYIVCPSCQGKISFPELTINQPERIYS